MQKLIVIWFLVCFTANANEVVVKESLVKFGNGVYIKLDEKGLHGSSEECKVMGSFALKDEIRRQIDIRPYAQPVIFPSHNIIIVRQSGELYLLDLQAQKEIGHITLPSRGAPNFITIEPNEKGMTDLLYGFRYLPEKSDKPFRPGPLVEHRLVFSEGSYALEKKGEEDE